MQDYRFFAVKLGHNVRSLKPRLFAIFDFLCQVKNLCYMDLGQMSCMGMCLHVTCHLIVFLVFSRIN